MMVIMLRSKDFVYRKQKASMDGQRAYVQQLCGTREEITVVTRGIESEYQSNRSRIVKLI